MAELVSQSISIQSLYGWYGEDHLFVNRRYQRKLVWTLEEKQRLIESILKKYPVPAILVAEREDEAGTYEIIDGLQRLHAIISFIETGFATLDNKHFDLEHYPAAKRRADEHKFTPETAEAKLTAKEVTDYLDYSIALSVMRKATETEVNDVFGRINTYGHRLSDQERRQSGVQNDFSNLVRTVACTIRGDASTEILSLKLMPSISVDLSKTKQGYQVRADEVVWVAQGILRSTDLRDSLDEQCIADIAACIVGGELIERSKDALDDIYTLGSTENQRISTALNVYGAEKFSEEFKFCLDEILKVTNADTSAKLRDILFIKKNNNAFPSAFAALLIAFHELIVSEGKQVTDYSAVKKAITNLSTRIETTNKASAIDERRKNINVVKGLLKDLFIKRNPPPPIYGNHATTDIESAIRRSEIEVAGYELKQGLLSLSDKREVDTNLIDKVIKTICAIANNGRDRVGKIIIGVTDKDSDAERVKTLDKIEPKKVSKRYIVGVSREAKLLGVGTEKYFAMWKDAIKKSALSSALRDSVLSSMDYNDFYGLGVIVITVPAQKDISYVADQVYWRSGESTELTTSAKEIAAIAKRF